MTDYQIETLLMDRGIEYALIETSVEPAVDALKIIAPQKVIELENALHFLQSEGMRHKDLHSGNVMMDTNGNITIIDFGSTSIKSESKYNTVNSI